MPAFATHYLFAKELMEYVEELADFKLNQSAVYYGTQGPDVFFFHRVLPWMKGKSLRKYGSMLHRCKPEILFENFREYCKISTNKDVAKSYTYGFILHYALDRKCHPYVYALQNKITSQNKKANPHSAHNCIEFAMDTYLLEKRLNVKSKSKFNTSTTINCEKDVVDEIGKMLAYVVKKSIDMPMTSRQGSEALVDLKYVQNCTNDSYGIKRIIISPMELLMSPVTKNYKFTSFLRPKDLEKAKKYANIDNKKWKSPYSNEDRYESFEDLFELAKNEAKEMLKDFQQGKNCKDITNNISFLTGVEVI